MISNTTLDKLRSFRLSGLIEALIAQTQSTQYHDLAFEDRLALLVDAEHARRIEQQAKRLLRQARIPSAVSLDDVDFSVPRGLKKQLFLELVQGGWLTSGSNVIITGPTGVGKTFLSSVLTHSLCLRGVSVNFQRTHLWLADFLLIDERRRFAQTIAGYRKVPLLVFDEWLRDTVTVPEARLLLDLFDERYQRRSCMFVSQLPISAWHQKFEDATLADAILDRIVHSAMKIELSGESMRKLKTQHSGNEHFSGGATA